MRLDDTYNPLGIIPPIQTRKASEEEVFDCLGIEKTTQEKTYLAAFLATCFCKFMIPVENAILMRPGEFGIASKMAKCDVFCLAAPIFANIYRGLNKTISSLDPATCNVVFPTHYLYGWLVEYFRTHFCAPSELNHSLMVKYSGQGGARHFGDLEAQALFKSCRGVVLHHLALTLPQC
ncbi:hypothetical protein Vadar_000839 [Vaccinium darrowii]|uniref:Uncharacterized protein n=1 Tax=Vaccinium darrowii TaxID=229202 RepID=A0ACB7XMK9_9ERIC|nr:hypothetical protein Vadar_000839 [Vaccinium darrowii]